MSRVVLRPHGSGSQIVRTTMELVKELKIDFNKAYVQAREMYERRYRQQIDASGLPDKLTSE
ncbi:MAG: hypothetical protein ACK5O7_01990 [Holosporales bacterium]